MNNQVYVVNDKNKEDKIQALFNHLTEEGEIEIDKKDITVSAYDSNSFEVEGREYLVLIEEEADERAKEEILNSIWAFNASFIEDYTDGIDAETIKIIQEAKYEDANEPIKRMIKDLDSFVEDAISADGRGHFLSGYDGEENEQNINHQWVYIYRTN